MARPIGGEGLFAGLKSLLATLLAIIKTRAELLIGEVEEEKFRLVGIAVQAVGAVFFLVFGIILGVLCLVAAFWEQRVLILGLLAGFFLLGGIVFALSLRRQASQPSRLFRASLAELEDDLAILRAAAPVSSAAASNVEPVRESKAS